MNAFQPTTVSVELGCPQSSLEVVSKVFSVLDAAGIKWCLSHGYEPLLSSVGSDVDIIVERSVSSTDLVTLFTLTAAEVGDADVHGGARMYPEGCWRVEART